MLDRFLADPPATRLERRTDDSASAVVRFEELVNGLFS
jgi:hypothetical protein